MTSSITTQSFLAAQDYTRHFMSLDREGFQNSLADEVVSVRITLSGEEELDKRVIVGKKAVVESYQADYFSNTKVIWLKSATYFGYGLHTQISSKADVEKLGLNQVKERCFQTNNTLLVFKREGSVLKIVKIWEKISLSSYNLLVKGFYRRCETEPYEARSKM